MIWVSMQTLLVGAAMALEPLIMDYLNLACLCHAKVNKGDRGTSHLCPAGRSLMTAPEVIRLLCQYLLKPLELKKSLTGTAARKSKQSSQSASSQLAFSEQKDHSFDSKTWLLSHILLAGTVVPHTRTLVLQEIPCQSCSCKSHRDQ